MSADVDSLEALPTVTIVAAFVTSELRTAFQMGFVIFLPFVVVDLIVASVLMSMGMFMLPPAMVSLPFKLLLFVLADGWTLVVQQSALELPRGRHVTSALALELIRHAIMTCLLVAAPLLLVALLVGVLVSLFQAVTSLQEQTLTFIPEAGGGGRRRDPRAAVDDARADPVPGRDAPHAAHARRMNGLSLDPGAATGALAHARAGERADRRPHAGGAALVDGGRAQVVPGCAGDRLHA